MLDVSPVMYYDLCIRVCCCNNTKQNKPKKGKTVNFLLLSKTMLFRGIEVEEIPAVLDSLGFEQKKFTKGEIIFRAGDIPASFGIVLSGSVIIENTDFWGNTSVLDKIKAGQTFGATYAFAEGKALMVNVVATEEAEVLFLHVKRLLGVQPQPCLHYNTLMKNLLSVFAQKNLHLSRRIFHTSSKSIRGRLMSYLSHQAASCRNWSFSIPFDRQQLADYLSVDRSALSHELGKMQKEGLLKTSKNHFELNAKKSAAFLE